MVNPMIIDIQENVLVYRKSQLASWKARDKTLIPDYFDINDLPFIHNQNEYSFGEMFVLSHFFKNGGWKGLLNYSLGSHHSRSPIRWSGQQKVRQIVPPEKLEKFRRLRGTPQEVNFGAGEPDLFLYRDIGDYMFIEVKKERDFIRPIQMKCLSLIKATLDCPIGIVYLREEIQHYGPKTYLLDLDKYEGHMKSY
jgi:hypothetical protein